MDIERLSIRARLAVFLLSVGLITGGALVPKATAHDAPVDVYGCHEENGARHCH